MAYFEGELDILQNELSARFASLRDSRGGAPVYALEHGLDSDRLRGLRDAAGSAVRRIGAGAWWRERPLPLLVVATEVGYGYRGTGTDYWPALCEALAAELSFTEHTQLSALFESAHAALHLKKPADTPWNRLFRHIAWPISNAIAPLEIHRGLAQALQRVFQSPPPSLDDADLAGALRVAARAVGSPRLQDWVADPVLAVAISRRLMRLDQDDVISREAMERIWRDLRADNVARRAIRLAMREQRGSTRAPRHAGSVSTPAVLQLLAAGSGEPRLALSASFAGISDAQRRLVRGLSLPPWVGAEEIGIEAFLLGHPQTIRFDRFPAPDAVFLPRLREILGDVDLRDRLTATAPDMAFPLVFTGTSDVGVQVPDRHLYRHRMAWLVTDDIEAPEGVEIAGRIGSAVCLHIPDPARVADWLARQGVGIREWSSLEPVAALVIGETPTGPVIGQGLPALFRLAGEETANISAGAGDPGVSLSSAAPYLLAWTGVGEQRLTVSFNERTSLLSWTAASADHEVEAPLSITLDPASPSLEMLQRGEVAIHIRTSLRLAPGALTLSVVAGEGVLASSRSFGVQLPALITAGDGIMDELVRALVEADIPRSSDVWLTVDIKDLCRDWWPLRRELRRVVWERNDRDWRPCVDEQVLDVGVIDADQPYEEMRPGTADDAEAVRLLLPVAGDGPIDDAGFIVGPRRLNVAASPSLPGHPGRFWREGDGVSVQVVCLNYLRWSWAEARNPLLEAGRRSVASSLEKASVVQFCGAAWSGIEDRYGRTPPDPWSALAEVAMSRGLAAGDAFPDLSGWKGGALLRHLAQRFAKMAPDLFAAGFVSDDAAEQLDLAVGEAWEDLFEEVLLRERRFVVEDVDPGNATTDWSDAVTAALERVWFSELLTFVLPRSRALALSRPDYQDLSLDEIGDILIGCHVDLSARGQPRWTSNDDIRNALLFWARPRTLATEPGWMSSMQRLLSDRQTARAVRYAALRYSASRGQRV